MCENKKYPKPGSWEWTKMHLTEMYWQGLSIGFVLGFFSALAFVAWVS